MESDPIEKKFDRLFAAARKAQFYSSESEYGFESRVMERIREKREGQRCFLLWAWRLIPVFVSLVVFMGLWVYASESRSTIDLSAITKIGSEEATLTAFLTGE
jgi:hypothetical protein